MDETKFMARAIELAERGRGYVEPNPLVGSVVVREGQIVGEGYHPKFGEPHAEVFALREAGELARGATLYVALEPCCHFGKTPPCTDAIIAAGVKKVVAAMLDPFEKVSGQGFEQLRNAGIAVESGLLEEKAKFLNRPYLKRLHTGKAYVHAKWAMSLDGKICTRTGDSKWISSEEARAIVHQKRGLMDAIITGRGTLLADDPLLTVRPPGPRTPTRIVLSKGVELLPTDCQLLRTIDQAPVILAVNHEHLSSHENWKRAGAEILGFTTLDDLLMQLGQRGMTNVWLEGGSGLLGSFLDSKQIDEAHCFIAPILIGGTGAKSPAGGTGANKIAESLCLTKFESITLSNNLYLHGLIN